MAAANLYGQTYGIKGTRDNGSIEQILEKVQTPPFNPKSSVKIHLTDQEMEEERKKESGDAGESEQVLLLSVSRPLLSVSSHLLSSWLFVTEKAQLEELKGKLSSLKNSAQMHPIDFEKVKSELTDASALCTGEATDRYGGCL